VIAFGLTLVGLAIASLVFGDHGLLEHQKLRAEHRGYEEYAFELQQHNDELRRRVELLRSDARYLENLARERLGLVRPNEVVYLVDDDPPAFRSQP
jgi:cell division protein FtsB